ncbi:MAG: glutamate 5-kinase [Myxococcales bacterium]|nr:glutamate 5-kinase [Myxococcales bacterium]USN51832.1 MAG: glutamate 5-kinase [Myxococcales bacterium]
MHRTNLINAEKIVIKIGSRVLLEDNGNPNYFVIAHIVDQLSQLHKQGKKIIFVSSGAIGAGMEALSLPKRPSDLPTLQAAAAIGQVRLMRAYEDLFGSHNIMVAQVLLTHEDLKNRARHLNIKNTLNELLKRNVIPIINENDAVSVDEIKFGDNDVLASLVAMLLEVKALILLTTSLGFMIQKQNGEQEKLSHIVELNQEILSHIQEHKVGLSSGGMKSKLIAAHNLIHVGGLAIIAPGKEKEVLLKIFNGENVGTIVGDPYHDRACKMPGRKRWIAFYNRPCGFLNVDDGAKIALIKNGKSLLSVGVRHVEGEFAEGDVVAIRDGMGAVFAKGISQMTSQDIKCYQKENSKKLSKEVVHRDNLVLLKEGF